MKRDIYGLRSIPLGGWSYKLLAIGLFVLSLAVVVFGGLWQIGNMIADFTSPTDPSAERAASYATTLSGRDPLARWLEASVIQDKDANEVAGFETVVRLSPSDYRWWVQLGRSYEQAGKTENAEKAFLYANEISPSYVVPKWQLGNFYLRNGNEKKAVEVLRKAAKLDPGYRDQIFGVVWDFFERDPDSIKVISDGTPLVQAGLAKFYAAKGLGKRSLEAWSEMSPEAQKAERKTGLLITQALYDKGLLLSSARFVASLDKDKAVAPGTITNAGFESPIGAVEDAFFSWKISSAKGFRARSTGFKKRSGKKSLELVFTGFVLPDINNVYQTVAVEGGKTYELSFFVKSEGIASTGRPKIQLVNAKDSKPLGETSAFDPGTTDWQRKSITVLVPEGSEGIAIRTSREYCGDNCPLNGKLYYDDFEIKEVG